MYHGDGIQTSRPRGAEQFGIFYSWDSDTYIDLDIKLFVRGKMVCSSGKDVDLTDPTAVANNLLHSLFSQCKSWLTVYL